MIIVAYAHPPIMAESALFNGAWPSILLDILLPLCKARPEVKAALVLGSRYLAMARQRELPANLILVPVNEKNLHQDLIAAGCSLSKLSASLMHDEIDDAGVGVLTQHIMAASQQAGWVDKPNLILSFAIKAKFLNRIWPAPVFHIEMGPFSRAPFPPSLFMDHAGIYDSSSIARHAATGKRWPVSADGAALGESLRGRYKTKIDAINPFKHHDYRRKFGKLCLLPLQVSGNFTFDEQSGYHTQLEYLTDILAATPKDVGLVVTEYNHWVSYLDTMAPSRSLEYLKTHPSFLYPLKSRNIASPSLFLAPMVDGVWTVSSNVGYLGLFFDKWLGSASTHLAPVAAFNDSAELMKNLGTTAPKQDGLINWLLERYYIPQSLYTDARWMFGYLQRRLEVCGNADAGTSFPALADVETLKAAWAPLPVSEKDLGFLAPDAWARKAAAAEQLRNLPAASDSGRWAKVKALWSGQTSRRSHSEYGYILLNDTKDIEGARHLGSSSVTQFIHDKITAMDLVCFGSAMDQEGIDRLEHAPNYPDVRLIVFNGEGSVIESRQRIQDLMAFCGRARAAGKRTVLINSIYQGNSDALGAMLKNFDIVAVRESRSQQAMARWRPDARVVPDFCFEALYDAARVIWNKRAADVSRAVRCAVIDSVLPTVAETLHDYARFHELPFFAMGVTQENVYKSPEWIYQVDGQYYPRALLSAGDLAGFSHGVTGRFHGLIALLLCRIAPVALRSNSHKIEGLLEDMGLAAAILLPDNWAERGHYDRQDVAQKAFAQWDQAKWQKVDDYIATARQKIAALFDDIAALLVDQKMPTGSERAVTTDVGRLYSHIEEQRVQLRKLDDEIAQVYASHSWRMTRWLRVGNQLRGLVVRRLNGKNER